MTSLRLVVVASTNGSVLNQLLQSDFFRRHLHSVVVDRACGALDKAKAHGVRTEFFEARDNEDFCRQLADYMTTEEIDYVLSYYTKFYSKAFRDTFKDRILNVHPSLLPAFKGMDGFGDAVRYHARFVGNTVEFIDEVMDEGKIIMQTVCPLDQTAPVAQTRHRVFVQQCKAVLQVVRWLVDDRVSVDGRKVTVQGATFDSSAFSPALDLEEAKALEVEMPARSVFEAAHVN